MTLVLDTTVLVYALGGPHPARTPCRWVVEAAGSGTIQATTTVEVIQEFTHVRARRIDRANAVRDARLFVDLLSPLLTPHAADLDAGLDMFSGFDEIGSFDAVLASTARRRGHAMVSVDAGFSVVPDLEHLNPLSSDFLERAASSG